MDPVFCSLWLMMLLCVALGYYLRILVEPSKNQPEPSSDWLADTFIQALQDALDMIVKISQIVGTWFSRILKGKSEHG
ncbi:MAG TPA: hypothetical protein PKD09_09425 [Aggregatilinea sp.]|uniref:hypothetical protein n=1 Tax=Aggregatilinea sp. TaxID=2806333 RepID=UPI002CF21B10|nr:hypothetical protein [Aggregatilinea sp.]HML21857.1 hypothetical protein [Aggregatilinea sp.]